MVFSAAGPRKRAAALSTVRDGMDYIQKPSELEAVAEALDESALVAADTEAAGFHRYFDRVCLLQLSTRDATYVVDTLMLRELDSLSGAFADPATEIVFHDADYDLRLLHRDFGITVHGLFDTKIAAQFVGERGFGLAALVEKYLGVRLEKAYQRADWAKRPLPRPMLEYAALDTYHLPALRDRLREALDRTGRTAWAQEEFALVERVRWTPPANDDAYLRIKGTRDLGPRQLAALRELYDWRDQRARSRDVATFRVLSNEAMVELARHMPKSIAELRTVPAQPRSLADRYGHEVIEALDRARRIPAHELPERPRGPRRPPPDPEFDALVDRLRGARDEAAEALDLERGFLMPRGQLEAVARARPSTLEELAEIKGVRRWQVEALGEALLEAIRG